MQRDVYAWDVSGNVAEPSTGPPTSGIWQANQVVLAALNSTAAVNGIRGWRCARGGKPGQWTVLK